MSLSNSSIEHQNLSFNCNYPLDHPAVGIPHHPLQYRAIGIIQGKYQPFEGKLTKGVIISSDNHSFETVLLGKTISAVKNHIDLNDTQNWVVYPHSIPEIEEIHFQIAGIYIPDNISSETLPLNYFSIRGEVLYSSKKEQKVIVKICKNKTLSSKRLCFFKLELHGKIPDHNIKHFYSFTVILEGKKLVIKNYIDLGLIAVNV